jgi:hypothetical protein
MSESSDRLAVRYGNTKSRSRQNRAVGIVTAVGFAAVLGAWLWWGGVLETPAQVQTRELGHIVHDERNVSVRFEVTTPPGTTVNCAVQALSASYGIVGWKIVTLESSDRWTRTFEEPLVTSEPAVTGLLYECWLP